MTLSAPVGQHTLWGRKRRQALSEGRAMSVGEVLGQSSSIVVVCVVFFFFSSRRRHTRFDCDWSSDVCSSDLVRQIQANMVQRRVIRIHWSDRRPVIRAATANANGTVNPMNPRYSMGGWM